MRERLLECPFCGHVHLLVKRAKKLEEVVEAAKKLDECRKMACDYCSIGEGPCTCYGYWDCVCELEQALVDLEKFDGKKEKF